jgi:hypothetical protein
LPGAATLTVAIDGSKEVDATTNFQATLKPGTSMLAGSRIKLQIPIQQLVKVAATIKIQKMNSTGAWGPEETAGIDATGPATHVTIGLTEFCSTNSNKSFCD